MMLLKTGDVYLNLGHMHILWGNDVDEAQRTPLDYWMVSFPSQMLADISIWTSNCLPQGCANAKEEEILSN